MGFLDHTTNNIIVDAVLTDKGREKLANATTGGLKIIKYAFADNEVDYTLLEKYGEIVGKEKIEKNTPIFEASTSIGEQHYKLLKDFGSGTLPAITLSQDTASAGADLTVKVLMQNYTFGTYTMTIYYNSNIVSPYNYSGTISNSGVDSDIKVIYQTVTQSSTTQADTSFSVDFVKKSGTNYSGSKEAHIVVKSDDGTTSMASNFTLTFP